MTERTVVGPMELRHGRWQDVLADVPACDLLLCDPPYSARTHEGRRHGKAALDSDGIDYGMLDLSDDVARLVAWATERVREFVVIFGDHETVRWWRSDFECAGWYVFPPSIWHKTQAAPRYGGDGPGCSVEQICVARQRVNLRRKEHRADHFSGPPDLEALVAGAKPVWLMQALVAAYSEPGDLVVDAYAGSGTTLIAASQMGRRSIGAEMDAGRYALAARRLRKGYTPDFFSAA
jgi:hypothetical protein